LTNSGKITRICGDT